jgi:PAS domain-containing protein
MEGFLLNNVLDQIVVWRDDTVHYVNASFLQSTGYSNTDLLGTKDLAFIWPSDRELLKDAILRCKSSGSEKLEVSLRTSKQEQLHTKAHLMIDNELICGFFRNASQDINQKMKEITAATEVKSRFLATMSHGMLFNHMVLIMQKFAHLFSG